MRRLLSFALAAAVAAAVLAAAVPATAQNWLGSYTAYIGPQDLVNSNGQRLWEPWQIIRQDRANFHRFNRRDVGDHGDPWCVDADARAALEQAVMNYPLDPASRQAIVQGSVWVQVDVYGWGNQIQRVAVAAWR